MDDFELVDHQVEMEYGDSVARLRRNIPSAVTFDRISFAGEIARAAKAKYAQRKSRKTKMSPPPRIAISEPGEDAIMTSVSPCVITSVESAYTAATEPKYPYDDSCEQDTVTTLPLTGGPVLEPVGMTLRYCVDGRAFSNLTDAIEYCRMVQLRRICAPGSLLPAALLHRYQACLHLYKQFKKATKAPPVEARKQSKILPPGIQEVTHYTSADGEMHSCRDLALQRNLALSIAKALEVDTQEVIEMMPNLLQVFDRDMHMHM